MAEPLTGGAVSGRRTGFGARGCGVNVMARNCDDHTRNFSFILKQGGSWELAPAYDATYADNPKGEWTFQHLMSVREVQGHYASRFTRRGGPLRCPASE